MKKYSERIAHHASRFARDEGGQAITEYILLLTLTIASTLALAKALLAAIAASTLSIGGQLEKDLKTGRAALDIWAN